MTGSTIGLNKHESFSIRCHEPFANDTEQRLVQRVQTTNLYSPHGSDIIHYLQLRL